MKKMLMVLSLVIVFLFIVSCGTGQAVKAGVYKSKTIAAGFGCTDSDGGNKSSVKGTVTGYYFNNVSQPESGKPDFVKFTDYCLGEAGYTKVEGCLGINCGVKEHTCIKEKVLDQPNSLQKYIGTTQDVVDTSMNVIECPYGCQDGACKPKPKLPIKE